MSSLDFSLLSFHLLVLVLPLVLWKINLYPLTVTSLHVLNHLRVSPLAFSCWSFKVPLTMLCGNQPSSPLLSLSLFSAFFPILQHPFGIVATRTRHNISGAAQSSAITYHDLAPTLLLMHPKTTLALLTTAAHHWLMFQLWSTKTPRSFLQVLLVRQVLFILNLHIWFFPLKCRILHFTPLNNILLYGTQCSSL